MENIDIERIVKQVLEGMATESTGCKNGSCLSLIHI